MNVCVPLFDTVVEGLEAGVEVTLPARAAFSSASKAFSPAMEPFDATLISFDAFFMCYLSTRSTHEHGEQQQQHRGTGVGEQLPGTRKKKQSERTEFFVTPMRAFYSLVSHSCACSLNFPAHNGRYYPDQSSGLARIAPVHHMSSSI